MKKKKVVAVLQALGCACASIHYGNSVISVAYVLYDDDTVVELSGIPGSYCGLSVEFPYTREEAKILLEAIRDGVPSNLK